MINMHTHTIHSPDGFDTIDTICQTALARNLQGVAFTDHTAINNIEKYNTYERIRKCKEDVYIAKEKYKGKLKVLFGLEISEAFLSYEKEQSFVNMGGVDVVLCSLHSQTPTAHLGINGNFRLNDFTKFDYETIIKALKIYYKTLNEIAVNSDFDILAHLTYPLRYISCRDKVEIDINDIMEELTTILKTVVSKNKAIEINTSMADQNFFMPDKPLITLFKSLGGKYVTLGSDAHKAENLDKGLFKGVELLKECGFSEYYYYENRKPIAIKIK